MEVITNVEYLKKRLYDLKNATKTVDVFYFRDKRGYLSRWRKGRLVLTQNLEAANVHDIAVAINFVKKKYGNVNFHSYVEIRQRNVPAKILEHKITYAADELKAALHGFDSIISYDNYMHEAKRFLVNDVLEDIHKGFLYNYTLPKRPLYEVIGNKTNIVYSSVCECLCRYIISVHNGELMIFSKAKNKKFHAAIYCKLGDQIIRITDRLSSDDPKNCQQMLKRYKWTKEILLDYDMLLALAKLKEKDFEMLVSKLLYD